MVYHRLAYKKYHLFLKCLDVWAFKFIIFQYIAFLPNLCRNWELYLNCVFPKSSVCNMLKHQNPLCIELGTSPCGSPPEGVPTSCYVIPIILCSKIHLNFSVLDKFDLIYATANCSILIILQGKFPHWRKGIQGKIYSVLHG